MSRYQDERRTKAETTTVAAQQILKAEAEARRKKTALLRKARLAEVESGEPNISKEASAAVRS
jgi:hypothetical protein